MIVIDYISSYSILVPTMLGAIFFVKLRDELRTLALFVFVTCALEFVSASLFHFKINNMFLFHVYSFIEFAFISVICYQMVEGKQWKRLILFLLILFEFFSLLNIIFLETLTDFNSIQRYIGGMITMFYCGIILVERMKFEEQNPLNDSRFILVSGFLVYFSGTLYLFYFGNEVLGGASGWFWVIHSTLNILLNSIYALVFWRVIRRTG